MVINIIACRNIIQILSFIETELNNKLRNNNKKLQEENAILHLILQIEQDVLDTIGKKSLSLDFKLNLK